MAYISAEEVKVIRNNLKKAFPEIKFSVRNDNHSWVRVVIKKSPYDFELNGEKYRDVNHYHFENENTHVDYNGKTILPHTHQDKLRKILDIIAEKHWDESDIMTDYFNCAFYYSLSIGEWDAPYIQEEPKKKVTKPVAKKKELSKNAKEKKMQAEESFASARMNMSEENDNIVISAFENRGIEATPREDVFTFNIWKHKFNRIVKKGEKGVKIGTYFKKKEINDEGDEVEVSGRRTTTVFHISQTKEF